VPFWIKTTTPVPVPNSSSTVNLANGGTIQFNVFTYNTTTPKLFSTPVRTFSIPEAACGLSQFNQGNQGGNNDSPKFVKTSGNIFTVGRNMNCQVFDTSGFPVPTNPNCVPTNGNCQQKELRYSYVYMADVASKTSWIVTSTTEELVGIDVIPDQNGNGSEELALSFHSDLVRVMVIDPLLPLPTGKLNNNTNLVAAKTISNKSYSIGNPD
jgi:hypothetical protein